MCIRDRLEVGESAGVVMPSGCRMGICRTCLTPLRAGQVRDLRTGEVHGEEGDLIPVSYTHLDVYKRQAS